MSEKLTLVPKLQRSYFLPDPLYTCEGCGQGVWPMREIARYEIFTYCQCTIPKYSSQYNWAAPLLPSVNDTTSKVINLSTPFDIDEDIDPVYSGAKAWAQANKGYMQNIHLRVEFGPQDKSDWQDVFWGVLAKLDKDCPLDPLRNPSKKIKVCQKCHGMYWHNTLIDAEQIARLGRQLGLHLKVRKFKIHSKCGGELKEVASV